MSAELLICNGQVVAETHHLPRGYVRVRDGRIASIGEDWSGEETDAARRGAKLEKIDAGGLIIGPGFIDMHTHGIGHVSFVDSDVEELLKGLADYARFGVTRVVGSTISYPFEAILSQVRRYRQVMEDRALGDLLAGAHVEGPWLAARCRGGHDLRYLKVPERGDVDRLLGEVGDVMRSVTFAPELPGSVYLTEQLAMRGILPVMGHTEASFEDAERAILAGARHVTHMYDTTLGYRENPDEALVMMPGMETAALGNDAVSIELIGCPVHVPKPFFRFIDRVKPRHRKVIVSDSLVGAGLPDGTVLTYKSGHKVYVEQGVIRMINDDPAINGNLTGSAVTLNVGLRRLREYTGLPVSEAVRWGSLNPATTLGIARETGSIAVGKFADIVLMDERFDVQRTFLKGRTVYRAG